jgi:hypothetical protein
MHKAIRQDFGNLARFWQSGKAIWQLSFSKCFTQYYLMLAFLKHNTPQLRFNDNPRTEFMPEDRNTTASLDLHHMSISFCLVVHVHRNSFLLLRATSIFVLVER